jgi:hypothetical protein
MLLKSNKRRKMMNNRWPLQKEADAFYGNPRGSNGHVNTYWAENNLVRVATPWNLFYAGKPIRNGVTIHRKAADSLDRVFKRIWDAAAHSQAQIDAWGMSDFSGSFNYRAKRGSSSLSMHAYGAAIDFDADRNGFGDRTPHFAGAKPVLDAFAAEGWVWGGTWSKPDGMHWQAARVR